MTHQFDAAIILCFDPRDSSGLFVSRKYDPSKLGGVPGGKREGSETFRETAIREFREETGFNPLQVSDEHVFEGIVKKSGAFVKVYLGTISDDDWAVAALGNPGPEGFIIRKAHLKCLVDENECEFAEFYIRILAAAESYRQELTKMGLETIFISIKNLFD